jgi:hypothetical protein
MRARALVTVLVSVHCICSGTTSCDARDTKQARDGSSFARAFLIPPDIDDEHFVHWEHAYMRQHYPSYATNVTQELIQQDGRMYDTFSFPTATGQKKVFFDVTRQYQMFQGKSPEKNK